MSSVSSVTRCGLYFACVAWVSACGGSDGSDLVASGGAPATGGVAGRGGGSAGVAGIGGTGGGGAGGAAAGFGGGAPGGAGGEPTRVTFMGDPMSEGAFGVFEQPVGVPSPIGAPRPGTIYAPSRDGGATVAPDGPFPLVVVLHGFSSTHGAYANFSRHFATWGFAALAFDFFDDDVLNPRHDVAAEEVSAAIDLALSGQTPAGNVIDPARIATAGHSLGGKIAFFAAALDPRVRVIIGWDPVDSGGAPCFVDPMGCHRFSVAPNSFDGDTGMMGSIQAASLIFGAPVGSFNPEEHHARRFWEGTKPPGMFVYFPAGDHLNWPVGAVEEPITKRTQIAWLFKHFSDFEGLGRFFDGDAIQPDIDAGRIEVHFR